MTKCSKKIKKKANVKENGISLLRSLDAVIYNELGSSDATLTQRWKYTRDKRISNGVKRVIRFAQSLNVAPVDYMTMACRTAKALSVKDLTTVNVFVLMQTDLYLQVQSGKYSELYFNEEVDGDDIDYKITVTPDKTSTQSIIESMQYAIHCYTQYVNLTQEKITFTDYLALYMRHVIHPLVLFDNSTIRKAWRAFEEEHTDTPSIDFCGMRYVKAVSLDNSFKPKQLRKILASEAHQLIRSTLAPGESQWALHKQLADDFEKESTIAKG